jgi:hypothetical protein
MTKRYLLLIKRYLLLLAGLLGIHLLLRCWFWFYNRASFPEAFPRELGRIFIRGLQQDWVTLLLCNAPVIALLLVLAWIRRPAIRRPLAIAVRVLFIAGNALALAFNCIDIGYFRFGLHRANLDLGFVFGDSLSSFKSILAGYWPILLAFLLLVAVLVRLARRLPGPQSEVRSTDRTARLWLLVQQLVLCGFLLVSMGFPGRPVIPATPLLSVSPASLPIAQNSLLTWCYSYAHRSHELRLVNYFPEDEVARVVPTTHAVSPSRPEHGFQKRNVIVFILESFSRCYVMPGDPMKAHTPFFDSLIARSLFFPHSFANGYTSNQGIVSILGGLPALMDEPFYYSEYANTPLNSLGNILKREGYTTNFLMGASRDHFGFGKIARMAGLDHGVWRDDFHDDRFYDGNWGIFDGPFLQFGARTLSAEPQPFLGVFFTITAHPPYTLPAEYRKQFDFPGKLPSQRAISYTDDAFRRFFDSCRQLPWYRNTLFVFCADHYLSPDDERIPFSHIWSCAIPIFIFDPSNNTGSVRPTIAGQVDLAPTVLDLLGYQGKYSGFGRDLLDTTVADSDRYVVNKVGPDYQLITSDYIYGYDPERDKASFLYHYTADSLLRNDLLGDPASAAVRAKLDRWIKANIQAYRQALTRRTLE